MAPNTYWFTSAVREGSPHAVLARTTSGGRLNRLADLVTRSSQRGPRTGCGSPIAPRQTHTR
jgi:hypothetical protein